MTIIRYVLRGGAEQFMEETERSLHNALLCPYLCCLRHHWLSGLRYWDMHYMERILYLISSGVLCKTTLLSREVEPLTWNFPSRQHITMGHQPIFFHPFSTLNCPDAWSKVPAQLQPNYRWQGAAYHWSHGQGIRGSHLIDLGCYNSWSKIITIWYRWSQGSCATTLASTRPTSWTSWGRNMLAMESGKIKFAWCEMDVD